jgi:hypothetical protein
MTTGAAGSPITWYPSASTLIGTLSGAADATVVGGGTVGVLVLILIATVVGVLTSVLIVAVFGVVGVSLVADAQPVISSERLMRSVMAMDRCMNILVCCDITVLYYNEWYLLCI